MLCRQNWDVRGRYCAPGIRSRPDRADRRESCLSESSVGQRGDGGYLLRCVLAACGEVCLPPAQKSTNSWGCRVCVLADHFGRRFQNKSILTPDTKRHTCPLSAYHAPSWAQEGHGGRGPRTGHASARQATGAAGTSCDPRTGGLSAAAFRSRF